MPDAAANAVAMKPKVHKIHKCIFEYFEGADKEVFLGKAAPLYPTFR